MPSGSRRLRNSAVSDAVGDLHVRRALGLVVERQVGHVGAQQLARPPHDRGQDRVDVADRGQVAGGLVERGQLGLAAALALHLLPQPHRHVALALGARRARAPRHAVPDGLVDDPVEGRLVRPGVQEVEERGHGLNLVPPLAIGALCRPRPWCAPARATDGRAVHPLTPGAVPISAELHVRRTHPAKHVASVPPLTRKARHTRCSGHIRPWRHGADASPGPPGQRAVATDRPRAFCGGVARAALARP